MQENTMVESVVKLLGENRKYEILKNIEETTLHKELLQLFTTMDPDCYVEITHGIGEYGKDLVIVRSDPFGQIVTSVVVIRGDIRTKSSGSGVIAKLKDQVGQSFIYPARLKAHKDPLQVNFVWVIVAGHVSKGANKRIIKEIDQAYSPNVIVRDLKWLAENFSKYYPHVFYEGQVSRFIEDRIRLLEKQHLLSDRKQFLTEYYINPHLAKLDKVVQLSDEGHSFSLLENAVSFEVMKREIVYPRKLVFVGDPGVGKSTTMAKLAIDIFSRCLKGSTRGEDREILHIPILITAKDFFRINSVNELLDEYGLIDEIRDRFDISALLIDGLDEVSSGVREIIIKKASEYAESMKAALVITTRKVDLVNKEVMTLERYELLPLEFGQAMDLFGRLVSDKRKLIDLKDGLERIKGQMPFTPLSLILLLDLVESNNEIPASMVQLYDSFVDLALGSEDRRRKGIEVLFDYRIKKKFLETFAFEELYQKDRVSLPKEEFETFVHKFADKFQWSLEQLSVFITEIERVGLLNIRETVKFTHASFLDYFVALRIFNMREEIPNLIKYVTDIYFNDWWYDVAYYYAGLKTEMSIELIDSIIAYPGSHITDNVAKALVGKLLQAAWQTPNETMIYGIEQSQNYCRNVRDMFLEFTKGRYPGLPLIYADLYTMLVCEMSYGSRFLWPASKVLIDRYIENPTQEGIAKALHLLWPMREKITDDERASLVNKLYLAINSATINELEDTEKYTKNLLWLRALKSTDQVVQRSILKRIKKQHRLNPQIFQRLLPPPEKGFRRPIVKEAADQKKKRSKGKTKGS